MLKYFKKLRNKNRRTREKAFAFLMISSMVFVVIVWIFNLGTRFNKKTDQRARNDLKPFKIFANSLVNAYNNVTASVGKIPNPKKIYQSAANSGDVGLSIDNNTNNK